MTKRVVKAAIYARVSTDEQREGLQLDECRGYCEARGWGVVGEYVDHGVSSRQRVRPERERLLSDVRRGRVTVVVVWKFDRFARSVPELVSALHEFDGLQVDFVAVTQAIDTTGPMGRLVFHILAALAEFERDLIRERVQAGMKAAALHGTRSGKPIGRVVGELMAAELVRAVEMRREGVSWRAIEKALGIPMTTLRRNIGRELGKEVAA